MLPLFQMLGYDRLLGWYIEQLMVKHISVLLEPVLRLFCPRPGARYLDGTYGTGGHTLALLKANPFCEVIALDQDPATHPYVVPVQRAFGSRFRFYDLSFVQLDQFKEPLFDGILLDLGLSSLQLETAQRGFSFRADGPVDMRMNPRRGVTARHFLQSASEQELIIAVRDYGEERCWRRVVKALLAARGTPALERTQALAELVAKAVGPSSDDRRLHRATRTFQGLRIAINDELGALNRVLPKAFAQLAPGGVLAVISFHSLEDRCVKRYFRFLAGLPEHAGDARSQQERIPQAELLTVRPICPTQEERAANLRSRSAKLRAIRKR